MFDELSNGAKVITELREGEMPDASSLDDSPRAIRSGGFDRHKPDESQMEDFWDRYKNFPLVRASIRSFASAVVSPGYEVEAPNEDLARKLEEWLEKSSIVSAEIDKDFIELAKKAIIQREVRGTALVEKVPIEEDEDRLYGFKLINPEDVQIYTRPGQAVLLAPDEDFEIAEESYSALGRNNVVLTDDNKIAAYVQYDPTLSAFQNLSRDERPGERPFTRDQIIKLTRDEDVGEVFGNSRLTAVDSRIDALENKLSNNDDAIESQAYPYMLFKAGTPEDPWTEEEIKNFIDEHKGDDFVPGMKQIVQGDMDVDEFAGETADIEDYLNFDVNMIMSEMPVPKYALGGFEQDVNQFVSRSQETVYKKQIEEARQEIESEFTPVLKEKAQEIAETTEGVRLKIEEDNPEEEEQQPEEGDDDDTDTDFTRPPASSEQSVITPLASYQENDLESLRSQTEDVFFQVREGMVEAVSKQYTQSLSEADLNEAKAVVQAEDIVDSAVNSVVAEMEIISPAEASFKESMLSASGESGLGLFDRDFLDSNLESYKDDVVFFIEKMADGLRDSIRRGLMAGDNLDDVIQRFEDEYPDGTLFRRAHNISHMSLHSAVEGLKKMRFEKDDSIIGYRVEVPNPTTRLERSIDGSEVFFEEEGTPSEQLMGQVVEDALHSGFNPIPSHPPFAHGDESTIVPIREDEMNI